MLLDQQLHDDAALIEAHLDTLTKDFDRDYPALFASMRYSLLAGGKRIRPFLTLQFCRLFGGDEDVALTLGCALEMIHTYSLIHDDLPCMDDDDLRRGKPTNHVVYGEATAVLAGDALLTDAFMVAARAELPNPADMANAIALIAECAGSMGMVGGQVLDIQAETRECTVQEVLDIQNRKTGRLISAACALGAIAGGASEEQFDAACKFAAGLGLAFQIRDDMLDVIGTREEMGKGVGTDESKNTFVRIYGLEKCEELVQTYTNYALDALTEFENTEFMTELAMSLTERRV